MMANVSPLVGLFPGFLGLVFVLVGALVLVRTLFLAARGARTRAKQVGSEPCGDGSRPIVEFADRAGVIRRVSLGGAGVARDGTLAVIYDPDNPRNVSCASFGHFWLFPLVFLGLGGVSTVMGVLICAGYVEVN